MTSQWMNEPKAKWKMRKQMAQGRPLDWAVMLVLGLCQIAGFPCQSEPPLSVKECPSLIPLPAQCC